MTVARERRMLGWVSRLQASKVKSHVRAGDVVFEYRPKPGCALAGLQCVRKIGFVEDEAAAKRLGAADIEVCREIAALTDGLADVAICDHELQLLLDPPDLLMDLRRLLNKAGRLFLFVPYRYRGSRQDASAPEEFYAWNAQTLGNLVVDCGFRLESALVKSRGPGALVARTALHLRIGEPGFRALATVMQLYRPALEVRIVATV